MDVDMEAAMLYKKRQKKKLIALEYLSTHNILPCTLETWIRRWKCTLRRRRRRRRRRNGVTLCIPIHGAEILSHLDKGIESAGKDIIDRDRHL